MYEIECFPHWWGGNEQGATTFTFSVSGRIIDPAHTRPVRTATPRCCKSHQEQHGNSYIGKEQEQADLASNIMQTPNIGHALPCCAQGNYNFNINRWDLRDSSAAVTTPQIYAVEYAKRLIWQRIIAGTTPGSHCTPDSCPFACARSRHPSPSSRRALRVRSVAHIALSSGRFAGCRT